MDDKGVIGSRSYNIANRLPKEILGDKQPKCYYLAVDNSMSSLRGTWVDWTEYGWFVLDDAKKELGY